MDIKPIKRIRPVSGSGSSAIEDKSESARAPIRAENKSVSQEYLQFREGKLWHRGRELGEVIRELVIHNPGVLAEVARELKKFKEQSRAKKTLKPGSKKSTSYYTQDQLELIDALCNGFMALISSHMSRRFDRTRDGWDVTLDDAGQLIVNGVNIHTLVEQCRNYPNPKSLAFIKGTNARLNRLLESRSTSGLYEKLHDVILSLIGEIEEILRKNT